MKKCFLLLIQVSLLSGILIAQNLAKTHFDQKDFGMGDYDLSGLQSNETYIFDPLSPLSGADAVFQLTDSIHVMDWNASVGDWVLDERRLIFNDCDLGKRLEELQFRKNIVSGNLEQAYRLNWTYYPSNGSEQTFKLYNWDKIPASWVLLRRDTSSQSGLWLDYQGFSWDTNSNEYDSGTRDSYRYNSSDSFLVRTRYKLDIDDQQTWVFSSRDSNFYDANNLLLEAHQDIFDTLSQAWIPLQRRLYSYNNSGEVTNIFFDKFLMGDWAEQNSRTNYYDSNGKLEESVYSTFDNLTGSYKAISHNRYTYEAAGSLSEDLYQVVNTDGQYIDNAKITFTYYPDGQLMQKKAAMWFAGNSDWLDTNIDSFSMNGLILKASNRYDYNLNAGNVGRLVRNTYQYDADEQLLQVLTDELKVVFSPNWINKTLLSYEYDSYGQLEAWTSQNWSVNASVFENDFKFIYYNTGCLFNQSEETVVGADKVFCQFPNPMAANQALICPNLEGQLNLQISLFDLAGRPLVRKQFQSGDKVFEGELLAPGIYLLVIEDEKGGLVYRSKLVLVGQ